jgi:hypothetical protein
MSLQSVGAKFVELCNQLKNFDVMNSMYAEDIVSIEADGSQTTGKKAVIEKSKQWGADKSFDSEKIDGPFFNGKDQFAVHGVYEVTPKATGKKERLEEVALYTVKDDKIVREQFFYAGAR